MEINKVLINFQIEAEGENHKRLVNLLFSLSYPRQSSIEFPETLEVKDLIMVKLALLKLKFKLFEIIIFSGKHQSHGNFQGQFGREQKRNVSIFGS